MIVTIIISFIPCVCFQWQGLLQILAHQRDEMMSIKRSPWSCLQTANKFCLLIHTDMCFESIKIIGLFNLFAFWRFYLAFVFYSPFGIWIAGTLSLIFSLFIFSCVDIGYAMNTINNLN